MNLKGKQTYDATPQQIWDLLMDTEKLAKITPGVSKLELIEEDQYKAVSEIKIGPVKGAFKGDLFLVDKEEPSKFTLKVKQLSKIGNADATVAIHINGLEEGQTELAFDGKAKLSGTLARTGQRVLTGVANSLTKQFFKALGEELQANQPTPEASPPVSEVPPKVDAPPTENKTELTQQLTTEKDKISNPQNKNTQTDTHTSESITPESKGFFAWLKSLFGLS